MKEYVGLYAVRASVEKDGVDIVSFGVPFCAADDNSAIMAVRNSIKEQIETGILDKDLLKHHKIYCIGRYYFAKKQPIAASRPKPRKIFECSNFVSEIDEKEEETENA